MGRYCMMLLGFSILAKGRMKMVVIRKCCVTWNGWREIWLDVGGRDGIGVVSCSGIAHVLTLGEDV